MEINLITKEGIKYRYRGKWITVDDEKKVRTKKRMNKIITIADEEHKPLELVQKEDCRTYKTARIKRMTAKEKGHLIE